MIAGSDGSGLIYRISPAGEGFVLYSAPKKEITALALDRAKLRASQEPPFLPTLESPRLDWPKASRCSHRSRLR